MATPDRIKRTASTVVVPELPKLTAVAVASGRKDLVKVTAAWDQQMELWRKQLQSQIDLALQ